MEFKTITRLAEIMSQQGLTELEVKDKDTSIRLCRAGGAGIAAPVRAVASSAPAPISAVAVSAPVAAPAAKMPVASAPIASAPAASPANFVTSPMPGTFFSSSSPDAPAFVAVGDKVKADTVVGIVEAMKVMNEVKAEAAGTIAKIFVANGSPVEFGQKLFEIR